MRFLIDEETAKIIDKAIEYGGNTIDDSDIAATVEQQAPFCSDVQIVRDDAGRPRLEMTSRLDASRTQTQMSLVMLKLREELVRFTPDPALF